VKSHVYANKPQTIPELGRDWTCHWRNWAAVMPKRHRECRKKIKSVPAESWGTFVWNCVPHLIAVCVLYTEIKISALFLINGVFYYKIKSCAVVVYDICMCILCICICSKNALFFLKLRSKMSVSSRFLYWNIHLPFIRNVRMCTPFVLCVLSSRFFFILKDNVGNTDQ
jgi:hypothetical protein